MTRLKTPRHLPLGESEKGDVHHTWNTIDHIRNGMEEQGLGQPLAPKEQLPELTGEALDTATHDEYLHLNTRYLSWLGFILPLLADVKGELLQIKNEKTDIETRTRSRIKASEADAPKADRTSKEDLQDIIWLDARYQVLTQREQKALQHKLALEAKVEILERTMRVISRHVEVKKMDMEQNRIENNYPRRRVRSQQ